jgi:16S rRNA (cytosine967-C5)-methyltransferase
MRTESPRDLALKILNSLANKTDSPDNYLDDLFQSHTYLDERDRAFIVHLVQGLFRWRLRLDWVIGQFTDFPLNRLETPILNILRLALFQIFFLDKVPESAAVNEAVKQVKSNNGPRYIASYVNGLLRNICRHKGKISFPDKDREPVSYLSVFHSYPQWLVDRWIKEFGKEFTENLLLSQNNLPRLNVRTNTLFLTRDRLIEYLAEEGVTGKPTTYAPEGVILEGFKGRVTELNAFKSGLFQVQDQAAIIMSHLIAPQPSDTMLDICAGLGGKSTHMAALNGGKGNIIAVDINRRRLMTLVQNARRLGIYNIQSVVADASKSLSSALSVQFDKVILDAPCSGLGTISRHPDIKWNRDEGDIIRLSFMQKTIMNETARVIKKGGRILYVTCTISKEENEDVVEDFLVKNSDMSLENLKRHVPEWGIDLIDAHGFFRTFPHIHHMDGFFGALFTKSAL